jgi:hypothetical protein
VSDTGAIFYRGPSLLTGDPIVAIATGLEGGSHNPKTGPMVQTWILRPDLRPMDAKRQNLDDAICGDCKLRGESGLGAVCYVATWLGPANVYKSFIRGNYLETSWAELQALVEGRHVRLGAYGDPAAVPFEIWRTLLTTVAGHVAYTHAWRRCDPRFKTIAMASVDTVAEFHAAHLAGWRTFRIRTDDEALLAYVPAPGAWPVRSLPLEFVCPASDEGQHRTTCQTCQLCRGTSSPARSVAIVAHGHDGVLANFYRGRQEAAV